MTVVWTQERRDVLSQMLASGETHAKVGRAFGLTAGAISSAVNRYDLHLPTPRAVDPHGSLQAIAEDVAQRRGVTVEDLKGPRAKRELSNARLEAYFLARLQKLSDGSHRHSYPRIGAFFGGRDHSTVLKGERRFRALLEAGEVTL